MKARLLFLLSFVLLAGSTAWAAPNVLPNQVLLCDLLDGLGHCHSVFLQAGMRQNPVPKLPPAIAGKVMSIFIGSDVVAVAFYRYGFDSRGGFRVISQSNGNLGNSRFKSLIVTRKTKDNPEYGDLVGLFIKRGWGFKGLCPVLGEQAQLENRCSFSVNYPDESIHLKLLGLAEAELFEGHDYSGRRVAIPGLSGKSEFDLDNLKNALGWQPSSIIVRYAGNKRADRVQMQQPAQVMSPEATKHRPPPAAPKQGITPGKLALPPSSSLALQYDKNIRGGDYKNFELPEPRPELCRDACQEERRCRAFTYVKPGFQGKKARCWLKEKASPPQPAPCCVSGVKQ